MNEELEKKLKIRAEEFAEMCNKMNQGYPFGFEDMRDAYMAGANDMIDSIICTVMDIKNKIENL